jgi:hypothetical protein
MDYEFALWLKEVERTDYFSLHYQEQIKLKTIKAISGQ